MDYSAFDPFIKRDTWHTFHPLDERVFFQCLHKVVHDPNFSPEEMGRYIRDFGNIGEGSPFEGDVDKLVSHAWAVRDYLDATKQL